MKKNTPFLNALRRSYTRLDDTANELFAEQQRMGEARGAAVGDDQRTRDALAEILLYTLGARARIKKLGERLAAAPDPPGYDLSEDGRELPDETY